MKLLFVWSDGKMRLVEYPEAPPVLRIDKALFARDLPIPTGEDVTAHDVVLYEEAEPA